VRPGIATTRIEVDEQVVRLLHVADPRGPGVKIDAAQIRDPGERSGVIDHRKVGRPSARELDRVGLEPFGMGDRDPLLVEERAIDAVRVAEHLHDPLANVRQHRFRYGHVIIDQVTFGESALREEDLIPVGDRHIFSGDLHVDRMTHHALQASAGGPDDPSLP